MALTCSDILTQTPQGLYCPLGDFHLDPLRPVPRALSRTAIPIMPAPATAPSWRPPRRSPSWRCATAPISPARRRRPGSARSRASATSAVRFVPAGHVLGSAQIVIEAGGCRVVVSGDYKRRPDPTCAPFECVPCDVFITEATFGLPVFRHPDPRAEVDKLLESVRLFPERAHLVGVYALGKAQRLMALIREAGYREPIYIHGALERLTDFYRASGIDLGDIRRVAADERGKLGGAVVLCPPSAIQEVWSRRFPDPVTALASGWMRVRARGRQQGVELPLVISDHCDWDELCQTIAETGAGEVWVTHGQEDALVHWCISRGIRARPLHMLGYGDEEEGDLGASSRPEHPPDAESRDRVEADPAEDSLEGA